MLNLIKVDLVRLFKSKQILICFIIILCYSALTCLVYGVMRFTGNGTRDTESAVEAVISNIGIGSFVNVIIACFIIAFINKDIKEGTLRNKIISGYKRNEILLSYFVAAIVFGLLMILLQLVLLFSFLLAFFNPDLKEMNSEFVTFSFVFDVIAYLFLITFAVFLGVSFNNTVGPICIYIAFVYGVIILYTVTITSMEIVSSHNLETLFKFLSRINYGGLAQNIGNTDKDFIVNKAHAVYAPSALVFLIVEPIILITGLVGLSSLIINKKQLK